MRVEAVPELAQAHIGDPEPHVEAHLMWHVRTLAMRSAPQIEVPLGTVEHLASTHPSVHAVPSVERIPPFTEVAGSMEVASAAGTAVALAVDTVASVVGMAEAADTVAVVVGMAEAAVNS